VSGSLDTPELTELARAVRWAPVDPQDAARIALADAGRNDRYGRLEELAIWWASVRDDAAAPPPARAVGFGVTSPLPDPARLPVRRLPWDHPSSPREALAWGVTAADAVVDEGADLLLVAVDEPRGRRVLAAELLGTDAVDALGWPVPVDDVIDDARWMSDVVDLRDGLRAVKGLAGDPAALLDALGDARLAAATGLLLGAAARRTPVVLDGPGAATTALLVRSLAWEAPDWWQVAPAAAEPLQERVLGVLRMTPLPLPVVAVEDGTRALLGAELVAAAAALLTAAS
jgi:nicotinate-nucleotide--dimethylbenzimidazole phosphoribosyltransferase